MIISWNALTAVSTLGLVIGGAWQVMGIRSEAKKERTLSISNRYDNDPVIVASARRVSLAFRTKALHANPLEYVDDVDCVLNYLDSVAIGIGQGVYVEDMVRDHLGPIIQSYVDELLEPSMATSLNIKFPEFAELSELCARWQTPEIWVCEIYPL